MQQHDSSRGDRRPTYAELPDGRAVGLYGRDEQIGALNLLTPDRTRAAAALVQTGEVFSLNAPISYPGPHPTGSRLPPTHVLIRGPIGQDDYLDGFYLQYGSQWDGFLHIPDKKYDCFYNANTNESVGIEQWAERGIAGRGVLLDIARWRAATGRPIDCQARELVTVQDLERCAAAQGVSVNEGTIVLVRFGWESFWNSQSWEERMRSRSGGFQSPGLEPSLKMVERLWDWGIAAIAGDNMALEAYPIKYEDYFMHVDLLTRLGIPVGEFWHLDGLAEGCADRGRYEFLITSAPMNIKGGYASPANAIAVL
jgi:kynurenine formamidase